MMLKKCLTMKKINNHSFSFYKKLFEERLQNGRKELLKRLKDIPTASVTGKQKKICEGELTKKDIFESIISMENNKSPDNDDLINEFYCTFWDEIFKKIHEFCKRIKMFKSC